MRPLGEGGKKGYKTGPDHMTQMAVMPIYSKNLYKSTSPEPLSRLP